MGKTPFLRALLLVLVSAHWACGGSEAEPNVTAEASAAADRSAPAVRPGIDILLDDSLHLVRGRRLGLITNPSGVDAQGRSTIDRLAEHPEVELVALFSPEHGIRAEVRGGEAIESTTDERTGLPIHSLYGEVRIPTAEMLDGIDVLAFDMQDVGARYYTYFSTMTVAMEAAGRHGIPFLVLDRPNPIGGEAVQGNVLDPDFATFVGRFPVAMRHGLTAAEFAALAVGEFGVDVDLMVAPMEGWRRSMTFEETGLSWIAPSPNMPRPESALHYPGTCLFEGTVLSVARGTDRPFEQVGAPWVDAEELAVRLAALDVPDAVFVPVSFTPVEPGDRKFDGTEVHGVRLIADGPDYDPVVASMAVLTEARALLGDRWTWRPSGFDRLAGTDRIRLAVESGATYRELVDAWQNDLEEFRSKRQPYLLYR